MIKVCGTFTGDPDGIWNLLPYGAVARPLQSPPLLRVRHMGPGLKRISSRCTSCISHGP